MKIIQSIKDGNERSARHQLIEELFQDFNRNRRQVYSMNFFRGVFFGFGTVLGGTVVVAIIIWVLGQSVGLLPPIIGDYIHQIINAMQRIK